MPVKDLVTGRLSIQKGRAHDEMFYPESWLAVHYLMSDPARAKQLSAFIDAVRGGEPTEAAFTRCFHTDFDGFQKALQRYVDKATHLEGKFPLPDAPEIKVTPLAPSADRLLLLSEHVRRGFADDADKARTLAAARQGAKDFPDDPLALKTLAFAEIRFGEPADSDAPLDKLLAAHPEDVEAHYLKGRRWFAAGRSGQEHRKELWDKARAEFGAAFQLDQYYYPAIYYSGLSRAQEAGPVSDNTVEVLLLAHDLAPQVDEISATAAQVLMRKGRYEEVVTVLEPIAYAPHPGQWSEWAQKLLAEARKRAAEAQPAKPAGAAK
jgi:tetratricopeptide (TPR) repeat protein